MMVKSIEVDTGCIFSFCIFIILFSDRGKHLVEDLFILPFSPGEMGLGRSNCSGTGREVPVEGCNGALLQKLQTTQT